MQFTIVNTTNDLRQLSTKNFSLVQTLGNASVGDGNARPYFSNLGDSRADNGTTIIAPVDNLGRWNELQIALFPRTINGITFDGSANIVVNPFLTNSLGADVLLNNTANYFDGPSVAQGTSGIWLATGTVTVQDNLGQSSFQAKLWDGTNIIASANPETIGANGAFIITTVSLSGVFSSPPGNIRISIKDSTSVNGRIVFNASGNSKDSTISVVRIG